MESSAEETARVRALEREAPMRPRGLWRRGTLDGRDVVFLCGTLGAEFDAWQRRLSATSAADALFSQRIGLNAVERLMDGLEAEARVSLAPHETLDSRRSPGYGDLPLRLSARILAELDATRRLGVALTESLLLAPSKSVTAIAEIVPLPGMQVVDNVASRGWKGA